MLEMPRTMSVGRGGGGLLERGADRRGAALPVQRILARLQCLGLGACRLLLGFGQKLLCVLRVVGALLARARARARARVRGRGRGRGRARVRVRGRGRGRVRVRVRGRGRGRV